MVQQAGDFLTPMTLLKETIRPAIYKGAAYHCLSYSQGQYVPDGAMAVDAAGKIVAFGTWADVQTQIDVTAFELIELGKHRVIIPGLIDMHVHLPQMEARGCQADDLLSWLEKYIFATEMKFSDDDHAREISAWFFEELLAHGTTTAAVFLTSHTSATNIAFEEAQAHGNRVIMGLNLMDKNAPDALLRPAAELLKDTENLCARWHGVDDDRLMYAWMPRFAITSTEELLEGVGKLRQQYPDVYFHTHLSEQVPELDAVKKIFPWADHYTHVYDRFGMLAPKSILAHGIYLSNAELDRIDNTQCGLAHCPSSNFFLKSGRFPWFKIAGRNTRFGLGSDVGAGPSLNMFEVMRDAQYTQQEQVIPFNALLYSATLGAAYALHLDDKIGNFTPGKEADFVILDLMGIDPLADTPEALKEHLTRIPYLADAYGVSATAVRGRLLYQKPASGLALAALARS